MADQVMTANTELANAIQEFWSPVFYPTLLASLPMNALVERDYEGQILDLGDTVHVQNIPEFEAADDISDSERVDADAVTIGQTDLTINHQYAKDFILTKKAQKQSLSVIDGLREMAVYAINKAMQSDLYAATVPSSSSPDHQIAYDTGTTLALADILEAKELLDDADVPQNDRHMNTDSAQANDLFNITGFTSRDFIPDSNAMSSGMIATPILGFQHSWSTEAGNVSRFFHRAYMKAAIQEAPTVEVFDRGGEGYRTRRFNVTALVGIAQFGNTRVVEVS